MASSKSNVNIDNKKAFEIIPEGFVYSVRLNLFFKFSVFVFELIDTSSGIDQFGFTGIVWV